MPPSLEFDRYLAAQIEADKWYPERLVMQLWKWGEGDLENVEAPDTFQLENFEWLGWEMRKRREEFEATGSAPKILDAIGSGRGIGKSADVGLKVTTLEAAFPDTKITVLANSGDQLANRTWPEIQKWLRRSLVAHWFESNTEKIYRIGAKDSWFAVRVTWNLQNPQASAGQHNFGSLNVFLFDEMSEIPNKILEVALTGMTTGLPIAMGRGNPTQPAGGFADALSGKYFFGNWHAKSIDSRTCRFPNKTEIAELVENYGEDSDIVRVWVRGLPPRGNIHGYFGEALISEARKARPRGLPTDALVGAVDFAWGGDDDNSISLAEGLDAWSINEKYAKELIIPGRETARPEKMIQVLADVMTRQWPCTSGGSKRIAMLFGDGSGICTEVFAGLSTLGITNVMAVNWSGVPRDDRIHKNIKAQIMAGLRERMVAGLGIPDNEDLATDMRDLVAVNFLPLQFEKKELMKKRRKANNIRDGKSSDRLDSLAMLNYMPVMLPATQMEAAGWQQRNQKAWEPASPYS